MNVSALVPPEHRDSVAHPEQLIEGEVEGFSLASGGAPGTGVHPNDRNYLYGTGRSSAAGSRHQ